MLRVQGPMGVIVHYAHEIGNKKVSFGVTGLGKAQKHTSFLV